jgi:hypothetical protein
LAVALAVAGCATSPASETYAPAASIRAERAEQRSEGLATAAMGQPPDTKDASPLSSIVASTKPVSQFFLHLLGAPGMSSAEEEALIERAIAEHEMRKP